jgi:hypothetical protein
MPQIQRQGAARCALRAAWCNCAACCVLRGAIVLHAACCVVQLCCMLHAACCVLHAACCVLPAARCSLPAASLLPVRALCPDPACAPGAFRSLFSSAPAAALGCVSWCLPSVALRVS